MEKCREEQNLTKYVAKQRNCLKCQHKFQSEWAGNRICDPCKEGDSGKLAHSHHFSDDIDFQYDLTIKQILENTQNTGVYHDTYDKKGFYKDEAQYRMKKKD